MPYGLYIHIPYCHSRCRYCNFYTAAQKGGVSDEYVQALVRNFHRFAPKTASGALEQPNTVYFGGGTPGLLHPKQVTELLHTFCPLPEAEITIEVNPESASLEKLCGFRQAGVNRLSVGVQSSNDKSLRALGRLHTRQNAEMAFENAHKAGFGNISGDIMLALPDYSWQEFDQTLRLMENGGATHISAYLLKIEPGTPFGRTTPENLPTADEAADFYLYAVAQLEQAGFAQYEISNFAKPGFEGKHNLFYWNCENYLGLGPSAHSCMNGRRFSFPASTKKFIEKEAEPLPEGTCTDKDYIMLQLRLAKGLSETVLKQRFGTLLTVKQHTLLQTLAEQGLAKQQGNSWQLTPQGFLVQNAILAKLL